MALPARELALKALLACRKNGAWSDVCLNRLIVAEKPEPRECALAVKLCYGVMQNRILCDYYISGYLKGSIKKLDATLLDILRIGTYQIAFLDRIPASAAVNESVELAKKYTNHGAAGLCNAVLRKLASNPLPEISRENEEEYLSIKYSHPIALVHRLGEIAGEDLEALLKADNEAVPVYAHVNRLKTDIDSVRHELESENIIFSAHENIEGCLMLRSPGEVARLPQFENGSLMIQDPAAYMAVLTASPKPGDFVVDVCAAPGGKSFASAVMMENRGLIVSCDIHKNKLRYIEEGAKRLGIGIIKTQMADARTEKPELVGSADIVIADVPCSGFGVIRKKPDIRYKDLEDAGNLPGIQLDIIENVSSYVKPGGVLLYSTCTVLPEENQGVIGAFLDRHDEFYAEPFSLPVTDGECPGMITLWPHLNGTDGFFIAKLRRKFV